MSDLASAFDPSFQGSSRHSDYIRRGFQGEGNYEADKISKQLTSSQVIFFFRVERTARAILSGHSHTGSLRKTPKARGERRTVKDNGSHSDIIRELVQTRGRTYYDVQGGNQGIG